MAVVGTGVIGASWAAHFLAHGLDVVATDPAPGAEERLRADVAAHWPIADRLGLADGASTGPADVHRRRRPRPSPTPTSCRRTVRSARTLKHELFARAGRRRPRRTWCCAAAPPGCCRALIAGGCPAHPERVLIGHPFNPPHLIPLVEVVPGSRHRPDAVDDGAMAFYTAVGKRPIRLRQEVPGPRRQPAAGRAVAGGVLAGGAGRGHASPTSTPRSPRAPACAGRCSGRSSTSTSPAGRAASRTCWSTSGRRWSTGGTTCGRPDLTPELAPTLVAGVDDELAGVDQAELVDPPRRRAATRLLAAKADRPTCRDPTTAMPQPGLDLDALDAIDMHVHIEQDSHGCFALDDELMDASAAYFKASEHRAPTLDHVADLLPAAGGWPRWCSPSTPPPRPGTPRCPARRSPTQAAAHADVLIPFGSVDPHAGRGRGRPGPAAGRPSTASAGSSSTRACRRSSPTTARTTRCTRRSQELGVPALFHTGQTGIGAGLPGGRGIKLRYSDPMLLDDVAADFPDLTIVMAHPSVPWQDEAISIATHKANVYIDLSGWSPKYFPPQLVRAANSLLKHKVLFGSDFPLLTPDRWLRDFDAARHQARGTPAHPQGQRDPRPPTSLIARPATPPAAPEPRRRWTQNSSVSFTASIARVGIALMPGRSATHPGQRSHRRRCQRWSCRRPAVGCSGACGRSAGRSTAASRRCWSVCGLVRRGSRPRRPQGGRPGRIRVLIVSAILTESANGTMTSAVPCWNSAGHELVLHQTDRAGGERARQIVLDGETQFGILDPFPALGGVLASVGNRGAGDQERLVRRDVVVVARG